MFLEYHHPPDRDGKINHGVEIASLRGVERLRIQKYCKKDLLENPELHEVVNDFSGLDYIRFDDTDYDMVCESAARCDDSRIINFCIDKHGHKLDILNILYVAIRKGSPNVIKCLFDKADDKSIYWFERKHINPAHSVSLFKKGHIHPVLLFIKKYGFNEILRQAVRANNVDFVKFLEIKFDITSKIRENGYSVFVEKENKAYRYLIGILDINKDSTFLRVFRKEKNRLKYLIKHNLIRKISLLNLIDDLEMELFEYV